MRPKLGLFGAFLALAVGAASSASARTMDIPNIYVARFSTFLGNTSCHYGSADCNRCVYNVASQFYNMTMLGQMDRRVADWTFKPGHVNKNWPTNYPPSLGAPDSTTFDYVQVTASELAVPSIDIPHDYGHFQSFVRMATTQDGQVGYFTTFDGRFGDVFGIMTDLVDDPGLPPGRVKDEQLAYMSDAATTHIGGMQAIGRHLVVAQEIPGNAGGPVTLSFYDFSGNTGGTPYDVTNGWPGDPFAPGPVDVTLPPTQLHAANVAAAKLAGGGYLLMTSIGSYDQKYNFYYTPSLDNPALELVNQAPVIYPGAALTAGTRNGFENLSLLTECGSGQLYVVGATGPDVFKDIAIADATFADVNAVYASDPGTWALYSVNSDLSGTFSHQNIQDMNQATCDPRGAGTAFAGENGELAFYCSPVAKDSSLHEALCAAELASGPAVGWFGSTLAALFDTFSVLSGGLIPPFGEIVAGTLLAADSVVTGAECGEVLIGELSEDSSTWASTFTEYWPTQATPETPAVATVPLTVKIIGGPSGYLPGMQWVRDMEWEHECVRRANDPSQITCTMQVPYNRSVFLVPAFSGASAVSKWLDSLCGPNRNSDSLATPCAIKNVTQPLTVTLEVATVI